MSQSHLNLLQVKMKVIFQSNVKCFTFAFTSNDYIDLTLLFKKNLQKLSFPYNFMLSREILIFCNPVVCVFCTCSEL